MSNLITITKAGEPTLRILDNALEEHQRLGWKIAPEEVAVHEDSASEKPAIRGRKPREDSASEKPAD